MARELTFWQRCIVEVQCNRWNLKRADARHVEAWMRLEHGTFNHMSKEQFKRAVLDANRMVLVAGETMSEALAQTFGF